MFITSDDFSIKEDMIEGGLHLEVCNGKPAAHFLAANGGQLAVIARRADAITGEARCWRASRRSDGCSA